MTTRPVEKVVRATRRLRPVRFLARMGFAVNGLVHAIIGLLAIGVAFRGGGRADQSGALGQLSAGPGSLLVLWVVTVALAALGTWIIISAFLLPGRDTKRRIGYFIIEVGKGFAYLLLAGTAFTYALGGSTDSERDVVSLSAALIATPGGLFLLLLLGLIVGGAGVYFIVKGVGRRFLDDIDLPEGKRAMPFIVLGVFGYVAKGVAVAIVGVLLAIAAVRSDPTQALGLHGSLTALVALPLGQAILTAIGFGLIAYGAYCLVRARVARL